METPHLDNRINDLKAYGRHGVLSDDGLNELNEYEAIKRALSLDNVISHLKFKLEVNAGRIAEPLLKEGKQPKDDENCHKAFLMLAHLQAIEDYINGL